jgi:hypothetical protein
MMLSKQGRAEMEFAWDGSGIGLYPGRLPRSGFDGCSDSDIERPICYSQHEDCDVRGAEDRSCASIFREEPHPMRSN